MNIHPVKRHPLHFSAIVLRGICAVNVNAELREKGTELHPSILFVSPGTGIDSASRWS